MSHEACGHCGNVHTSGDPYALIDRYREQYGTGRDLTSAAVCDIFALARCLHSQLYSAVADLHNIRLGFEKPTGTVLETWKEYAVRRRDGNTTTPTTYLDSQVDEFDHLEGMAREIGFESSGAEIVCRERTVYAGDWTPVPADEIAAARDSRPEF